MGRGVPLREFGFRTPSTTSTCLVIATGFREAYCCYCPALLLVCHPPRPPLTLVVS